MISVEQTAKSPNILIKIPINKKIINKSDICQQNLIENIFDPTNASPPNEFMHNLFARIHKFNNKPC